MLKGYMVYCDSGANIHSCNKIFVSFSDLGLQDGYTEEDLEKALKEIAFQDFEWYYEEVLEEEEK